MEQTLWLVRHGESAANIAATDAERSGAETLSIDLRDADVPLSRAGVDQAHALGAWIRDLPQQPSTVWCSPYTRARETARIALADPRGPSAPSAPRAPSAPSPPGLRIDERLRDRELGILDLLSSHGVERRHPDEAERRRRLGKFWYRPPGGESWADVALRLRSVLPEIVAGPGPVLVVAHDVVVTLFVYLCCRMSEEEILDLARGTAVGNASVTTLHLADDTWELAGFGDSSHLRASDAPVTAHRDEETSADVV